MSSKSTFSNSTSKSYATALYELSKEVNELDKVEDGMKSLNELLNKSFTFKEMILSPTIAKEDKKKVILIIADQNNFSKILKKFLGFLAIKNRLFFLNKIIDSFLNLVSIGKNELKVKLISSKKLSVEEQKKIQTELSQDLALRFFCRKLRPRGCPAEISAAAARGGDPPSPQMFLIF